MRPGEVFAQLQPGNVATVARCGDALERSHMDEKGLVSACMYVSAWALGLALVVGAVMEGKLAS